MTNQDGFVGEEAHSGRAPPVLDLIASAFLIALSVWVMIESVRLDMPQSLATAPGLLPFLVAASMGIMTLVLAFGAWQRYRRGEHVPEDIPARAHIRAAGLAVVIAIYLAALDIFSFAYQFNVAGTWLTIGSFELVSTIVITAILAMFWRKPLWQCFTVGLIWVMMLSAAFRYLFKIPLPG